jgi:hypothetical protein
LKTIIEAVNKLFFKTNGTRELAWKAVPMEQNCVLEIECYIAALSAYLTCNVEVPAYQLTPEVKSHLRPESGELELHI